MIEKCHIRDHFFIIGYNTDLIYLKSIIKTNLLLKKLYLIKKVKNTYITSM